MKLTRVGVDLAKQVFRVHGVDCSERVVQCKRLQRTRWGLHAQFDHCGKSNTTLTRNPQPCGPPCALSA